MSKVRLIIAFVIILVIALGFITCNSNQHDESENQNKTSDTIVGATSKSTDTSEVKIDTNLPPEVVDYPYPIKPSKENWQEDIGEVFVMLPDTFFLNHKSMNEYIGLNHKKRNQLVSGKKVTIKQHCVVSFEKDDDFNQLNRQGKFISLSIFRSCIDGQGVSYRLRPWETIEGEKIFGLFQLYGDHCCEHSNYWFLKPIEGGWLDVTEKVVGKITLYDFKRDKRTFPKIKGLGEYINDPWFFTDVKHSTDSIRTYLDFDYIDLGLSDEIDDSIQKRLNYELQLIWNGREFKKNLIQRTDLDE